MRRTRFVVETMAFAAAVLGSLALASAARAQAPDGATAGARASIPGRDACPAAAKKELYLVSYAKDSSTPCETVVSCTDVDKKPAEIHCQYFVGFLGQAGTDGVLNLMAGQTGECATRFTDLLGVYGINASAETGAFEGSGRICSSTARSSA